MNQLSDKLTEGKICELVKWQEELQTVHLLTCLVTLSSKNKNLGVGWGGVVGELQIL